MSLQGVPWLEITALGWTDEKYATLPQDLHNHVAACKAVRQCEKNALTSISRSHYREIRELLETDFVYPEEITHEVETARNILFSVVHDYIDRECVTHDIVHAILVDEKFSISEFQTEFIEDVRLRVIDAAVNGIRLALEEAFANHLKHGVQSDARGKIEGKARIVDGVVEFISRDSGAGFEVQHIPDPLAPENLEKPSGRGLFLMRHYMDTVEVTEGGTMFRMTKCIRDGLKDKPWRKAIIDTAKMLAAKGNGVVADD